MHVERVQRIEVIFCDDLDRSIVHERSEPVRIWAHDESEIGIESHRFCALGDPFLIDEVDLAWDNEDIVHLQINHLTSIIDDEDTLDQGDEDEGDTREGKSTSRYESYPDEEDEREDTDEIYSSDLTEEVCKNTITHIDIISYTAEIRSLIDLEKFFVTFSIVPQKYDPSERESDRTDEYDTTET